MTDDEVKEMYKRFSKMPNVEVSTGEVMFLLAAVIVAIVMTISVIILAGG